ncbi:DUF1800 family protein, partial [Mesorhizobium japonicum]|uniref:DUF1800 family protein n=1 Tax=Mesorhizobium japonicum TaxID=2066070 RepID=UPI003B58CDE0
MAQTFMRTDGNIASVLDTLFHSPEFTASLGGHFKDPVRYVLSAIRLAYDTKVIVNSAPVQNWLNRATERQLLQASIGNQPSLADVVKMVHPKPAEAWRGAFFAWLIGK